MTVTELQARLRRVLGARGMPDLSIDEGLKLVFDLANLEDPGYSEDPTFWAFGTALTSIAANNGVCRIIGSAPRTTVDGILFATIANDTWRIIRTTIGAAGAAKAIATSRSSPTSGQTPLAQTGHTEANQGAVDPLAGFAVAAGRSLAGQSVFVPLKVRLGPPAKDGTLFDMLAFEQDTQNSTFQLTAFGREWAE